MPQETIDRAKSTLGDRILKQVDEIIIAAMNKDVLAGIAVGIIQGESLIYAKGFGLANVEQEKSIATDTVFRIGSISKTFTAIALMQLWEQGKFQLDDPVNEYLKSYKIQQRDPNAPAVTFRHLLTHTSGIGEVREFTDLFRPVLGLGAKPDKTIPTLKEYYAKGLTSEVHPGSKWAYANHAFATLGQLIEDISGEPFPEYMLRHVFEPLGMSHTDYFLSDRVRDQLAQGYVFQGGKFKAIDYLEILVTGAGSVFSSVNDMAKYVSTLLNGGSNSWGSILKPETVELMMQPHYQPDSHLPAMGLSFFLDRIEGHRIVGHSGGWPGFVSLMLTAPDDGLGVVVFTNTSSLAPYSVAQNLLQHLLNLPDPTSQLPRPDILPSPHLWSQLCGFYAPEKGLNTNARTWMGLGGGVEVFVKDNHLQMRSLIGLLSKPVTLYPIDADNPLAFQGLQDKQPLPFVFKGNATGDINRLEMGSFYGLCTLYKRPQSQNPRFWLTVILSGLALGILSIWGGRGLLILILAFLAWRTLKKQ